jgi:copper chaperone CopZ
MLGNKSLIIACLLIMSFIFFNAFAWAEDSRRTFFKVNNLSCGICIGKINTKLQTFDGYLKMLANIDKGLVVVDHRQNLTDSEISEAITSIGYPAKKASESEYDQQRSLSSESPGWRDPSDGFFARIFGIFSR